ncbi:MAG: hypothetical protein HZA90_12570 [Verrucomicrobia bacterium]|nr:hypothetical protein [Verrucomicrobiota bacterium]
MNDSFDSGFLQSADEALSRRPEFPPANPLSELTDAPDFQPDFHPVHAPHEH